MTASGFGLAKFKECGEFLYGRFLVRFKGAVYKSYVWPAIPYGSEAWCMKQNEMEISLRTDKSMVMAMYGVHIKDGQKACCLILVLTLNGTIH